jgi:hypothetical protein
MQPSTRRKPLLQRHRHPYHPRNILAVVAPAAGNTSDPAVHTRAVLPNPDSVVRHSNPGEGLADCMGRAGRRVLDLGALGSRRSRAACLGLRAGRGIVNSAEARWVGSMGRHRCGPVWDRLGEGHLGRRIFGWT